MNEPTLTGHLLELSRALDDYRAVVTRAQTMFAGQIEQLWQDNAVLRDELHAVANRVENLTRGMTTNPAEVAERMLRDADR